MKILVISAFQPPPPSWPGSPRLFCLSRELATQHELHLVFPSTVEDFRNWEEQLQPDSPFASVERLPLPWSPSWLASQRHRLAGVAHSVTQLRHPEYFTRTRTRIEELFEQIKPDRILVHGVDMIQYVDNLRSVPIVVDLVDAMSLLYSRAALQLGLGVQRWRIHREARGYAALEQKAADIADALILVSDVDAEWIEQETLCASVKVIPNGVDRDYFSGDRRDVHPMRLLFLGVMDYTPNVDAASWFARDILPRIRQAHPQAELHIVGKSPVPCIQELAKVPGVRVVGEVPDVRPYFNESAVLVVPLRFGAGMKNKVLQGMAMEIPIVATSLSMEGIEGLPERDVLIGNSEDDFVTQVCRLLEKPEIASALANSAITNALSKHSWKCSAQLLASILKVPSEKGTTSQRKK